VTDNIIQIKRSDSTSAPESLEYGELAYSFSSNNLFIGTSSNTVITIAGGSFMDYLNHTPGTLTANSAIIVDVNSNIDNLSVENFRIQSSGSDTTYITEIINSITTESSVSNNQIMSAYAIKTYVDQVASSNVNITGGTIQSVTISELDEPIATSDGGTGKTSFTENGVLYASNTSFLDFISGANGEILQITSSIPAFGGIDGGEY